jgi:hypothetical protein
MEFFVLNEFGKRKCWISISIRRFDDLYAGASCQLTVGLIVLFDLCIFIKPLMHGALGFMLNSFHDSDFFYNKATFFTSCLINFYNLLVGSLGILEKWFSSMK